MIIPVVDEEEASLDLKARLAGLEGAPRRANAIN
jgi:hypothetical protein